MVFFSFAQLELGVQNNELFTKFAFAFFASSDPRSFPGKFQQLRTTVYFRVFLSDRHSWRAKTFCIVSREECSSFFHSTLLEGGRARGVVVLWFKINNKMKNAMDDHL